MLLKIKHDFWMGFRKDHGRCGLPRFEQGLEFKCAETEDERDFDQV